MEKPILGLLRCSKGLAAIEFALIAPIMIFIFFAVVEGADALSANRRVTLAVNTLADLVAQEASITKASLDDLFVGVEDIIDTRDIDVKFSIVSLVRDPDTDAPVVHWSRNNANAAPYAPGAIYPKTFDSSLLDNATSLIVAEVEYNYVSKLTQFLIASTPMKKIATRWPRRTGRVQFCIAEGNCTS